MVSVEQALRAAQEWRHYGKFASHCSATAMQALLPLRCQQCKIGACTYITFQYVASCPLLKALGGSREWQHRGKLTCHCSAAAMQALLPLRCQQCKVGACTYAEHTYHLPVRCALSSSEGAGSFQGMAPPWQTHLPLLCCSQAGFPPHPPSAVKLWSPHMHITSPTKNCIFKCIHRPESLTSMPGYSSSQESPDFHAWLYQQPRISFWKPGMLINRQRRMPLQSVLRSTGCQSASAGCHHKDLPCFSATHTACCIVLRHQHSVTPFPEAFGRVFSGPDLTFLTHGGCAESGGHWGCSMEPARNPPPISVPPQISITGL